MKLPYCDQSSERSCYTWQNFSHIIHNKTNKPLPNFSFLNQDLRINVFFIISTLKKANTKWLQLEHRKVAAIRSSSFCFGTREQVAREFSKSSFVRAFPALSLAPRLFQPFHCSRSFYVYVYMTIE